MVLSRSAEADGTFFYSVKTTGVYCRPSCAARPARPDNVRFHGTREEAEREGFRPCKRCRPDRPLREIAYTTGQCSLGAILVARSERGVCAILLGDDTATLEAELRNRHSRATRLREDPELAPTLARVARFVESPSLGLDVALDPHGTAFQHEVWQALREIPAGATASYADIARRIGAPASARAVAQACAANALAVAIPCHRVVRSDGSLSGYRWGVERKRALLDREARR
jgi:AraC family transcriptional regulator of adaptative response/methylated-DNA-[protein]-cysteine methyltransferase